VSKGLILTVNGGSSSLKCGLFESSLPPARVRDFNIAGDDHVASLHRVLEQVREESTGEPLRAIGHRVVHGGDAFDRPVVVDAAALRLLHGLSPLAPLHQPVNLRLIEACTDVCPGTLQVACFDTAFHRRMPPEARNYALPRALTEAGIHAYGFHGLSYEYAWEQLQASETDVAGKRVIIAHLGAGASLCAIRDGRSIATTMGFSTAEGLPMMTRTGSIDPGVLIYLVREQGMSADELEQLVYRESGLIGIAGEQGSMVELQASGSPHAREAIEYFVYRIVREIGSLTAALGGLDLLVFTGGIGQNDASIRTAVCDRLTWLARKPGVQVIAANEEATIAKHTARALERSAIQDGQGG
jgi:acetate kinase